MMLSSCHTKIWRHTRGQYGTGTEASVAHLDKSRRRVQLVYGRLATELGSGDKSDTLVTVSGHIHDIPPQREEITPKNIQRVDTERDLRILRPQSALYRRSR